MRQIDRRALLEELLPIARLGGEAIMAVYQTGKVDIRHKADASPVTEADLAAHRVLVQHLSHRCYPIALWCLRKTNRHKHTAVAMGASG